MCYFADSSELGPCRESGSAVALRGGESGDCSSSVKLLGVEGGAAVPLPPGVRVALGAGPPGRGSRHARHRPDRSPSIEKPNRGSPFRISCALRNPQNTCRDNGGHTPQR